LPSEKASAVASIWRERARLFASLTARPAPTLPHRTGGLPICVKKGVAAANAASESDPTMKVRLALAAPGAPPETGASRKSHPCAAAADDISRAVAGSTVEQSTRSV